MLNSIIIIWNKCLALNIALNTKFGLLLCTYLLDLGAKMVKCCNEGCINYLQLFGLWGKGDVRSSCCVWNQYGVQKYVWGGGVKL